MRVLVTGASGFIGYEIVKLLVEKKFKVFAMVRSYDGRLDNLGVKILKGDLNDLRSLKTIKSGFDLCVHCAANASLGNGPSYKKQNIETTSNILSFLKANKTKKIIFLSSIATLDRHLSDNCNKILREDSKNNPKTDYGKSKLESERLVKNSSLEYLILRPSLVVGSKMRYSSHFSYFSRVGVKRSIISKIPWTGSFSVIDVRDIALAIFHLIKRNEYNNIFNISGKKIFINDFFSRFQPKHSTLLRFILNFYGSYFYWAIPFKLKCLLLPALVASDEKLKKTGWQPKYDVSVSLDEVVERENARLDPLYASQKSISIVTGAGSGLGLAIAKKLHQSHATLLLIDKDFNSLKRNFSVSGKIRLVKADLTDKQGMDLVLKKIRNTKYEIKSLYLCAGFGMRGAFSSLEVSQQSNMINLLVKSRMELIHEMLGQSKSLQFCRLVLICSSSAFQPLPFMGVYAAANAALLSFGLSTSYEVKGTNSHLLTVCPGGMSTGFQKNAQVKTIEGEKLMSPNQVANDIFGALKKEKILIIISFRAKMMNLMSRLLPITIKQKVWGVLMEKLR